MKVKLKLGAKNEIKKKLKISRSGVKVIDEWNIDPALIKETCQKLLNVISNDPTSEPFHELVSKRDYPQYYVMIENPISIKEISSKIAKLYYDDMNYFKSDVHLMFNNCKTFNHPDSEIYEIALKLQEKFDTAYNEAKNGTTKRTLGSSSAVKHLSHQIAAGDNGIFAMIKSGEFDKFKTAVDDLDDINKLFKTSLFNAQFTWGLAHCCCYYGQTKMLDYLVEKGVDIETPDTWYGGRPLAWACFGGHLKTCKQLLEKYGAKKDATNLHGQTAFDLVTDKTTPWKQLFLPPTEVKLEPRRASMVSARQTPRVEKKRSSQIYTHTPAPVKPAPTPQPLTQEQIQHQIQQQILHTVRTARRVDARRVTTPGLNQTPTQPGAFFATPQQAPVNQQYQLQKNYQLSAQYSSFVSQLNKLPIQTKLISKIEISTLDQKWNETFVLDDEDIEDNIVGSSFVVPSSSTAITLKFNNIGNLNISGFHSLHQKLRADIPQPRIDPISFNAQEVEEDLECTVALTEATTHFLEFVIAGDKKTFQSFILCFIRQ